MEEKIRAIRDQLHRELESAQCAKEVENLKVKYLGKKGPVQELMQALRELDAATRPQAGKTVNELKKEISQLLEQRLELCIIHEEERRLGEESLDVTLPGRRRFLGRRHPLTIMSEHVLGIMDGMGFTVQIGPEIEMDYYNFEALNFESDHPARDMQDTFFITSDVLLRTHTSNTQVRMMEACSPPIRVCAPGKCYRNETITARSHVLFHQVEALYIDEGVTFADLIATVHEFLDRLFGRSVQRRLRPSYFPFVEPGMEIDISCLLCQGDGCSVCKHTGWLEIAGAGMVHPEVLKNGGIDPEQYTGYAWGMGLERLLMIRHGIRDIRLFTENDRRFLEQFA